MNTGKFVISLDFELMWGVRDKKTIEQYGKNIAGVHEVIPRLLQLFNKYNIHATFATVGFLFFKTKEELLNNLPKHTPNYTDSNLSPYQNYFETIEDDYQSDIYHFAPMLIEQIKQSPEHEIGTHTFSHYYCLESGQDENSFKHDIQQAIEIAKRNNISITSLVFPRNQYNKDFLDICTEFGLSCYRGNEQSWLYHAKNGEQESLTRRAFRLVDAYLNISGHHCVSDEYMKSKTPMDIPASRFLRPYSGKLKIFDSLRLHRIKTGMTHAAKNNLTYHLWWHPHNFGVNLEENMNFLEQILKHFKKLNAQYNFQSYTMSALANKIKNEG